MAEVSQAIASQGVVFARADGAGGYTPIAEITDFTGPDGQASVIDVSSLDHGFKQKLMGMADEGQVSLSVNLVPGDAGQQGLRNDRIAKTRQSFQMVLTDADKTTLTFDAYVLGFSVKGSTDERVTADVTLEITGQVVWSDAA